MEERAAPAAGALRSGTVWITAEGRYTQPSTGFLELFGATAAEVEGAPVGAFSRGSEEAAASAFQEFVASGNPVSFSESILSRPDGTTLEIRAVVTLDGDDPSLYRARFEELPAGTVRAPRLGNPAIILAEWRAAERALADMEPRDPSYHDAIYRVAALRAEYHRLFAGWAQASHGGELPSPGGSRGT